MISNRITITLALLCLLKLMFPYPLNAQYPRIAYENLYDYISAPEYDSPQLHLIIAGNPVLYGKTKHDVKTKFELAAMYLASQSRRSDRLVIFMYGKSGDDSLLKRIEKYKNVYRIKAHMEFRFFTHKRELIDFLTSTGSPLKIGSISFFSHSWRWGLTVGEKDFDRREKRPKKGDPIEEEWFEKDPQHLYPENFRRFMPKEQLNKIRSNFIESSVIGMYGCHTSVVEYKYEEPEEERYYFTYEGRKRTNYTMEIKDEPVAQSIANIFNATVLGTDNTTLFQYMHDSGKWHFVEGPEEYFPPTPIRMVIWELDRYHIVRPRPGYKHGKISTVKLRARPYRLLEPRTKFSDIWEVLSNKEKQRLMESYTKRISELKPLYDLYEKDFQKLSDQEKSNYYKEERYRLPILKRYKEREREYLSNKNLGIKWLNRYRLFYQRKINRLQKDLGVPLTTIKKLK